jgi:integrase
MAKTRLTAPFIEKVRPPKDQPQVDYFDSVLPAFGLRVGRKRKSYFVMCRVLVNGEWKMRRTTLGTTSELELAEARNQARQAMERAEQGLLPQEVKRERREAQKVDSRNTFSYVAADFLKRYRTRQKRPPAASTLKEMERVYAHNAFTEWQALPLSRITKRDISDVLDGFIEQGHERAANLYLRYLKMMFGWALDREIIDVDPTARIRPPGANNSRDRVLTTTEMRAIWNATEPTPENNGDLFSGIVKLLMLTGQRRSEVAGMQWCEIDQDGAMWSLPGTRTKNSRDHLIHLSLPVLAIIEDRRKEQAHMQMETAYVFTSNGKAPFSGFGKSKERLDARAARHLREITGDEAAVLAPWTLHDLRRTLVTRLSENLHVPPHLVEAIVNHVSGVRAGVAGVYNRAIYLDERRAALDAWADYVLQVVGEVPTANVVPIRGA